MFDADGLTNLIGYSAALVGTFLMVPQIVKSWRTRRADDLAFGMVVLYVANCALWLVYGLRISALPVIVTNAAALAISLVQLGLKIRFGAARETL